MAYALTPEERELMAVECDECRGRGFVTSNHDPRDPRLIDMLCSDCDGEGTWILPLRDVEDVKPVLDHIIREEESGEYFGVAWLWVLDPWGEGPDEIKVSPFGTLEPDRESYWTSLVDEVVHEIISAAKDLR